MFFGNKLGTVVALDLVDPNVDLSGPPRLEDLGVSTPCGGGLLIAASLPGSLEGSTVADEDREDAAGAAGAGAGGPRLICSAKASARCSRRFAPARSSSTSIGAAAAGGLLAADPLGRAAIPTAWS